jgi:hypothetical protein
LAREVALVLRPRLDFTVNFTGGRRAASRGKLVAEAVAERVEMAVTGLEKFGRSSRIALVCRVHDDRERKRSGPAADWSTGAGIAAS